MRLITLYQILRIDFRKSSTSSGAGQLLNYINDLSRRSLVKNTYPTELTENYAKEIKTLPPVMYAGFDPTADSLHIGNLLVLLNLLRGSRFGINPICIVGEATAAVGDPSGRSTERELIDRSIVAQNAAAIKEQVEFIAKNAQCSVRVLNNLPWFRQGDAVDFVLKYKLFRVGEMLRLGAVKSRMTDNSGISGTEFLYQGMQAMDWCRLAEEYNCFFQIGGSDQLGHLDLGAHYIKRSMGGRFAAGVCLPLITDKAGNKIGKSVGGGIWLNSKKTSPFHFYQFFRQIHDTEAEMWLPQYSLKSYEEIHEILLHHRKNLGKWIAQEALAKELTSIVHGGEGLKNALACSRVVFSGSPDDIRCLSREDLVDLFGTHVQLFRSDISTFGDLADRTATGKQKGRLLMTKGGFRVNGERILDPEANINFEAIILPNARDITLIRWGKRSYSLVVWN